LMNSHYQPVFSCSHGGSRLKKNIYIGGGGSGSGSEICGSWREKVSLKTLPDRPSLERNGFWIIEATSFVVVVVVVMDEGDIMACHSATRGGE